MFVAAEHAGRADSTLAEPRARRRSTLERRRPRSSTSTLALAETARRPARRRSSTPPTCSTPRPIDRMLGHFATLLAGHRRRSRTARRASCRCCTDDRAAPGRSTRWNDDRRRPFREPCRARARSSAQVARTPDAVAVVCGDGAADLPRARRARRTGSRSTCAACGVGPDDAGRRLRRALARAWSSACSAILKAGGAYVPLDPDYPAERLRLHARRLRLPRRGDRVTRRLARLPPATAREPWSCLDADRRRDRGATHGRTVPTARARATSRTSSTPRGRPAGPRA